MSRFKIVYALLALLVLVACQSANASKASGDPSLPATIADVPRMRVKELKALLDEGQEVLIVDARLLKAYEESHIAGAISLPLLEVDKRHRELPKDAKIVYYCT
jgi:hypothetical protein